MLRGKKKGRQSQACESDWSGHSLEPPSTPVLGEEGSVGLSLISASSDLKTNPKGSGIHPLVTTLGTVSRS